MLATIIGGTVHSGAIKEAYNASGAGTSVAHTIAADAEKRHKLHKVIWSYSAAPTGGKLTVTMGTTQVEFDVIAGGPGGFEFSALIGALNQDMVVTLAGGGGAVVGKLYIEYETIP